MYQDSAYSFRTHTIIAYQPYFNLSTHAKNSINIQQKNIPVRIFCVSLRQFGFQMF